MNDIGKKTYEHIRGLLYGKEQKEMTISAITMNYVFDYVDNLQSKIDKANEILNKLCIYGYGKVNCRPIKNTTKQEVYNAMYEIKNILKEAENVENN